MTNLRKNSIRCEISRIFFSFLIQIFMYFSIDHTSFRQFTALNWLVSFFACFLLRFFLLSTGCKIDCCCVFASTNHEFMLREFPWIPFWVGFVRLFFVFFLCGFCCYFELLLVESHCSLCVCVSLLRFLSLLLFFPCLTHCVHYFWCDGDDDD